MAFVLKLEPLAAVCHMTKGDVFLVYKGRETCFSIEIKYSLTG